MKIRIKKQTFCDGCLQSLSIRNDGEIILKIRFSRLFLKSKEKKKEIRYIF